MTAVAAVAADYCPRLNQTTVTGGASHELAHATRNTHQSTRSILHTCLAMCILSTMVDCVNCTTFYILQKSRNKKVQVLLAAALVEAQNKTLLVT